MKIKAKQIIFQRVEGRAKDRFWVTDMGGEDIWFKANVHISRYARSAPGVGGGYDKCDFSVLFEDGNIYAGRFDLQRKHVADMRALDGHISGHLTWAAANEHKHPMGLLAKEWLAKYEIPTISQGVQSDI